MFECFVPEEEMFERFVSSVSSVQVVIENNKFLMP
jgi:hypothetical protein